MSKEKIFNGKGMHKPVDARKIWSTVCNPSTIALRVKVLLRMVC